MDLRQLGYFVAVAEELHFGRAAARLHMSQPPLSRRIRELEEELDCRLLERSPRGVLLTDSGRVLLDEAKDLLEHAERAKEKVRQSTGHRTIVVGAVAGAGAALDAGTQETFRRRYPRAAVRLRECDLADPSAGLRTGQVDVAFTRLPFDTTGLAVRVLHEEPLVAVMPSSDPLAGSARIDVLDLRGRTTFRLPPGADPQWRDFWLAAGSDDPDMPVVSTIGECLHAVVWQSAVGLLPSAAAHRHATPGVSFVPLTGHRPSRVVLAWRAGEPDKLVLDLIDIAGNDAGPSHPAQSRRVL
ncbi:LysR substrate-binding domain-containing protein [Streptomyces sp. NBC_01186]|uniref:LysR family transcriptional regulator n=1 Tax=unclassified Streptomyces TaxID=2593676 RepID=UPI002DDA6C38|nr:MULTISPECIES: LysR substrate-binding domain-containing protein [unclassified Streptomyces]WSB80822.1 LysR substrate-binding domain-containing protein [Streptomyces sp. NBC_01775]WSS10969.1 LysR substrate-binding domain-containing protein [Streptomyces sp. NBC_01186]